MNKKIQTKDGVAVATIISAGIGAAVLGLNVMLSEASPAFKELMKWSNAVGPLSGKSLVAVIVWLVSWVLLHALLKNKDVEINKAWKVTLFLILIGWIGTFPPVFEMFGSH